MNNAPHAVALEPAPVKNARHAVVAAKAAPYSYHDDTALRCDWGGEAGRPVFGEGLLTPPGPGPTGLLESRGFAAL